MKTKRICFDYETNLSFAQNVTMHSFKLRIQPPDNGRQKLIRFDKLIFPPSDMWESEDGFGNKTLCGTVDFRHNYFGFKITGIAEVRDIPYYKGECLSIYKYPSLLTRASDEMIAWYNSIKPFADEDILRRALFFADSIYQSIAYVPGSTGINTTAAEAFAQKSGVCQDMTHILLAFLRMEKIPCRYAAGMACIDGKTHAWAEVYADGLWYGIDPTRNKLIDADYIKLSHGRDFKDCPIEKGIYIGGVGSTQSVTVKMEEV